MLGSAEVSGHFAGQVAARPGFSAVVAADALARENPFPAAMDGALAA